MNGILCYVAVQDGRIKRSSLEVLTRFRDLASAHGGNLSALLVDPEAEKYVPIVSSYGPGKIYTLQHDAFGQHVNELYTDALATAVEASGATTLAMASTEAAKDILGALAVRLGASVLPDVGSVDYVDGQWEVLRPVMAAKRLARTRALTS
ncbi:MAG: electron transfer flavoprotein subunit alpha/FixB family protein, partial [Rhodothermales bacterium]|nr:electron transfer flavoprotein subunit alpha/FixB family protein [Rhodothermales bacterium]